MSWLTTKYNNVVSYYVSNTTNNELGKMPKKVGSWVEGGRTPVNFTAFTLNSTNLSLVGDIYEIFFKFILCSN